MTTDALMLTFGLIKVADCTKITVSPGVTPTSVPPVIEMLLVPS